MANMPINEDQIMQLQAGGKVSPVTADKMKKAWYERPGSEILAEAANDQTPLASKEVIEKALSDPESSYAKNYPDEVSKAAKFYGLNQDREPAAAVAATTVVPEKASLDELAVAPKPVAAKPAEDMMKSSGINQAFGMQQKGLAGIAEAQSGAALEQEQALKEAQKQSADYDLQVKANTEERKVKSEEYMKSLNDMHEKAATMEKVNPNKYWQDKSTGSKVSSIIGLMLGAIGGGLTGKGGNVALDMLNKSIEQDIEAQKDAYQRFKGQMGDKQNMFSMAMNQLGDEKSALLASKASALQLADLKLKEIAARSNSQEVKARAQVESGKIMEELSKVNLVMKQQINQKLAASQATMGQGVEDPSMLSEDQQKRVVKMPNGLYKPAISAEAAKVVNETVMASDNIKDTMKKMEKIFDPALPYTEKAALSKTYQSDLFMQLKELAKLGVISGPDKKLVEPLIADPTSFRQDIARARMDALYSKVKSNTDNVYKRYVPGYKPIQGK